MPGFILHLHCVHVVCNEPHYAYSSKYRRQCKRPPRDGISPCLSYAHIKVNGPQRHHSSGILLKSPFGPEKRKTENSDTKDCRVSASGSIRTWARFKESQFVIDCSR